MLPYLAHDQASDRPASKFLLRERGGGGRSGTRWIPTAKRLQPIQGLSAPLGAEKEGLAVCVWGGGGGGGELQTKTIIRAVK